MLDLLLVSAAILAATAWLAKRALARKRAPGGCASGHCGCPRRR